jgi:hypothetical protein
MYWAATADSMAPGKIIIPIEAGVFWNTTERIIGIKKSVEKWMINAENPINNTLRYCPFFKRFG